MSQQAPCHDKPHRLRRVSTFAEAEVYVELYRNSNDWYVLHDARPKEVREDPDRNLDGYQGDIGRVKRRMRECGVNTYLLRHHHRCEHKGCKQATPYKHCAYHAKPEQDVVFCAMTGTEFKPEIDREPNSR